jgi:hypothetical protein
VVDRLPPSTGVEREGGGATFSFQRVDFNQKFTMVADITPIASQTTIAVARAEHVEPVRVLVRGYVITVVSIAILTVGLVVTACIWHWEWKIVCAGLLVLACLIVPTRTLVAKLAEVVLKAKAGS